MKRCCAALVTALLVPLASGATRNGDLDSNFGSAGETFVDVGAADSIWVDLIRLPDGKLLLGGSYDAGLPTGVDMVVARLNADGSLDTSFSFDGKVEIVGGTGDSTDYLFDMLVQPDGKVVLAGSARSPDPADGVDMAVFRLAADGSLDGSFGIGGKVFVDFGLGGSEVDDFPRGIARFADGKLIVAGTTPVTDEGADMALVKLNVDGSRDTSFGTGGRATVRFGLNASERDESLLAVAIDSQGRVVAAGATPKASVQDLDFAVARLLGNGQLDATFSGDGRQTVAFDLAAPLSDQAFGLLVGEDDAITLVGVARDVGFDMAVVRLLPDGSPLPGYGSGGRVTIPFDLGGAGQNDEYAISALSHGDRLLLVGTGFVDFGGPTPEQVSMLAQLLPDGQLDTDFGQTGKVVLANTFGGEGMATTTALADNGRAILGSLAQSDTGDFGLVAQAIVLDVLFADGYGD